MFGKRFARAVLVTATASLLLTVAAIAAVYTDKWEYDYGETVQITGDEMQAGESVLVEVFFPDGALAQSRSVSADESGQFAETFYLADSMPGGIYDVVATGAESASVYTTQFDPNFVVFDATPLTAPATVSPGATFSVTGRFRGDANMGSPKTAAATLSMTGGFVVSAPTTVSVTANNDNLVTSSWTVTAPSTGSASGTITLDNTGTANDATRTFTISVVVSDSTPPSIVAVVGGTLGSNGWYVSDVSLSWQVVDPESTISSTTGCGPSSVTADTASTTFTCSATSAGGTDTKSVTIKRDTTAPSVSATPSPAANGNGWNSTDVTVTYTGADALSGLDSCDPADLLDTEGSGQSATGSCTDLAGNSASATASNINIDKTAPSAAASATPAANGNGWNNTNVTVSFSGSDALSGIDSCSADVVLSSEGAGQSASGTCTDEAGNVSEDATASNIKIDTSAPSITFVSRTPANLNDWNNGDVTVTWSCSDAGSGAVSATVTQTVSSEGENQSVTGTCADQAGNTASDTQSGINIDTTAPSITFVSRTPANLNDWNNGDVTVTWSCSDAGSGAVSATVTQTVSSEGENQSVTGTCADQAGNTASDTQSGINIDTTAPSVSATPSPAANGNGWNSTDVTVTYTGADALSGLDSCDPADLLDTEGSGQSATGSCTDLAGNSASATASNINIDKTAPSAAASATPAANGNGWNNTNVTVSFSGSDALSGIDSCSADVVLSSEGAGQSASGTCTDEAGNVSEDATASNIKIDKTAPSAVANASPAADIHGWWNTDVTVSFSGSDLLSGIDFCSADVVLSSEGAGQFASGTCTDAAGNVSGTATASNINIDKTAPSVSATPSPGANANGWNSTDVTVTYTGADALSGLDFCDAADVLDTEGSGQSATGSCTDLAGNSASATASGINIDKTNPSVSLVGGPANGGSYYFGSVPAAPTCSASDSLSGLDGVCAIAGYGTTVGSHTVTASATDQAGNSASASATYMVLAWETHGFYRPVDMGATMNTVKGGSTVPLKFEVFAGPTEFTNISIVAGFRASEVPCSSLSWMPADLIDITSTGGTTLRYDSAEGQFIQNWKVPNTKNKCYSAVATFQDGSSIQAYFMTK